MHQRFFWPALACTIAAIDLYAIATGRDSLSRQHRNLASSRWWPLLAAGHVYLALHLYGVLPESRDPLSRVSRVIQERVR